jgi:hypothetical protein
MITILSLVAILNFINWPSLSEEQALTMIFGNYNHTTKSANWVNIPFPNTEEMSSYFEEKKGIVRAIFFQPYYEDGKNKIFLLTKTIPTNIPFDCHACLPLIGATVFVRKKGHWEIESQNQFIMYDGEYGELPVAKLIPIGKDRFGLSLEFGHISERDRELNILVPYKNSIVNAHREITYYENFNDCKYSEALQCIAYTANVDFNKSNKNIYYDLKIKRFGTIYNDKKDKTMPVDEETTYSFFDGKYTEINHTGYKNKET